MHTQALERMAVWLADSLQEATGQDWSVSFESEIWDFQFTLRCGEFARKTPSLNWTMTDVQILNDLGVAVSLAVELWKREGQR